MPKVKESSKYVKKYNEEQLQEALEAVRNGKPLREVSRKYNIPRATLQFRKSDKFVKPGFGPRPILSTEEEGILVKWIAESSKKGFPRQQEDIQASVKEFLDTVPRKNPFPDNCPQEGWYKAFLRRHPELTITTAEGVTSASANVAENDIRKWFSEIRTYLDSKGYLNILDDATRVFNGDETCFSLCPKNTKVLAPRGSRNVYEVEQGSTKSTITVMFTFSAVGLTTPPIVIFPGKRLRGDIQASVPAAFKPIKTGWRKGGLEWRRSNPSDVLTKEKFCPILDKVIDKYSKEGNIRSGFRACGLYPFDENAIDYSKCLGHNKSDSVKEIDKNNSQSRTLTFEKFRDIVGKDHITKFKEMSAAPLNTEEGTDKNVNILYRLWREIDTNAKATEISDRDGSTNTETANEECVEFRINDTVARNEIQDITSIKINAHNVEEYPRENIVPVLPNVAENLTDFNRKTGNEMFIDAQYFDIENMPIIFDQENEEHLNQFDTTDSSMDTSLKNILKWPITPKRKGTKNLKRMPFVLTSTQWNQLKRRQEEEKSKKIEEREERKKKRIESKILKDSKPKTVQTRGIKTKKATKCVTELKQIGYNLSKSIEKKSTSTNDEKKENKSVMENKLEAVTRTLFSKPKGIKILSDIVIQNKEDHDENKDYASSLKTINLSPSINIKQTIGLCYVCCNISSEPRIPNDIADFIDNSDDSDKDPDYQPLEDDISAKIGPEVIEDCNSNLENNVPSEHIGKKVKAIQGKHDTIEKSHHLLVDERFETLSPALDVIENVKSTKPEIDVVIIPPDVGDQTDEEACDDDDVVTTEMSNDVPGQIEIEMNESEDDENWEDDNINTLLGRKAKRASNRNLSKEFSSDDEGASPERSSVNMDTSFCSTSSLINAVHKNLGKKRKGSFSSTSSPARRFRVQAQIHATNEDKSPPQKSSPSKVAHKRENPTIPRSTVDSDKIETVPFQSGDRWSNDVSSASRRFPPLPRRSAEDSAPQRPSAKVSSEGRDTQPPSSPAESEKIPPVVLRNKSIWAKISSEIKRRGIQFTKAQNIQDGIRIYPTTVADYRALTKFSMKDNIPFHTYQLPSEKLLNVVFRDVPIEIGEKEIYDDLVERGFTPECVVRMRKGGTKAPMPLVLVKIGKDQKAIYHLKQIVSLDITVETLNSRPSIGQCFRCQRFGHAQSRCTAPKKCVACAGDHESATCPRPKQEPATCANCGETHPANYRGCTRFPRFNPQTPRTPNPSRGHSNNGRTYSQALSGPSHEDRFRKTPNSSGVRFTSRDHVTPSKGRSDPAKVNSKSSVGGVEDAKVAHNVGVTLADCPSYIGHALGNNVGSDIGVG
ncbi:reverse transcriptase [Holotrichia oblita]|uniref:Reverse transcriptase n=1 Tax=Holotrichia oblita TaxID=644536 RepID=A0ACB9TE60_HOLOL|nr:reverse transcriptase [Holotrichia oblita]